MGGCFDSECQRLDIAMLRRAGALNLEPGEIKDGRLMPSPDDPTGGAVVWGVEADEHGRPEGVALLRRTPGGGSVEQAVLLTTTPCTYGGVRHWFVCPAQGCGRRVRVLYLAPSATHFACRHCASVVYASTRATPSERLARREAKIESRMGWPDEYGGPRPRGMHRRTFKRLSTLHTVLSLHRHEQALDSVLKQEGLAGIGPT